MIAFESIKVVTKSKPNAFPSYVKPADAEEESNLNSHLRDGATVMSFRILKRSDQGKMSTM